MSFPGEFVDIIHTELNKYLGDGLPDNTLDNPYVVVDRAVRLGDPERVIGVFASEWAPMQDSIEIGLGDEPTLQTYNIQVQLQIKHNDIEEANGIFIQDAHVLRTVLYRAPGLRVGFQGLSEVLLGKTERYMRYGVRRQRFLNAPVGSVTVHLATTDLWIETETI